MPEFVSFAKVRAGFAQVGKDTNPYSLQATLSNDGEYQGVVGFAVPSTIANPDLKPEISTSWEFGIEAGFLSDRLGLDVTYYTQDTKNQVIPITLPESSGFNGRLTNAGLITNEGIEITLNATPIRVGGCSWDMTANYSKNTNKVVELAEGLDQYSLGGFGDNGEQIIAREGGPLMAIYGFKWATVDDPNSEFFGERMYNTSGAPVRKDELEYLGNANPDYIIGLNNTFSYKNLSMNVVLDIRQGGIIYSSATNIMYGGGYNVESVDWRDNGVGGEGVIGQSDGTFIPNNIVLSSAGDIKNIWQSPWRKISTNNFFDASFVKLREMNITYALPQKWMHKTPFSNASISLVGRNLFVWDDVPNQDADVYAEGIPGYTGGWTYPTSRQYGANLSITF